MRVEVPGDYYSKYEFWPKIKKIVNDPFKYIFVFSFCSQQILQNLLQIIPAKRLHIPKEWVLKDKIFCQSFKEMSQ